MSCIFRNLRVSFAVLAVFAGAMDSSAAIVISVGAARSTNVDLGPAGAGKQIDFFIGQDAASSDLVAGAVADFILAGGLIVDPPGQVGSISGTAADPFFGSGNLSTSTINFSSSSQFLINQEFTNAAQVLPEVGSSARWFVLDLDTTGLADGTYAIELVSPDGSFLSSVGGLISANNNLSFTVSPVPEPSSVAMFAYLSVAAGWRFSRRKRTA
ncbi:hypothetical protein Poly51_02040 [Rubripirellula tenax]|uniref:PEP-CTERM protein-sorting domain-containing protein n=1 Tax=Rubripirellula tenax TaxID=2528015 RepID=A0A5C6FEL1_9BACT|nr:hypothetical protein [Rubripirellula tenax]TWU59931.1 hypothetical protein Poly51_02040 [Rubripirellula tenax]